MPKSAINIYVADEIDPEASDLLVKKGFNVFGFTGLDNDNLVKLISTKAKPVPKKSALIIRSTRQIGKVMAEKISKLTDVKLICTVSSGFDNINLAACKKLQISVLNIPGGNRISAGEFTIALILSIAKNLHAADRTMKSGLFDNKRITNMELHGKTLGIIGVGRIGSHVAEIARAMGMKIVGNDIDKKLKTRYKWIKFTDLESLLKSSDIVTIHTPLDESTYRLINSENIALMQKHSVLINCARGAVIDEAALLESLTNGRIYYAGVDVFENEPEFNPFFSRLNNVILTPHIAGKTVESKKRMSLKAAENIIKFYSKSGRRAKLVN